VTDFKKNLKIQYEGILPDLFREGQGVVALGRMQPNGIFEAKEVLAKHDETYMPPELRDLNKGRHDPRARPLHLNTSK
jgi:cytochrome c-type biogenesis protein CcmE